MRFTKLLTVLVALAFASASAYAVVPELINYQGRLTNTLGNPVTDSTYSVTFTIYDTPAGGSNLWTEMHSVTTVDGLFSVQLGSFVSLPDNVFENEFRYLGITVSPNAELIPRNRFVSAPYSYRVSTIDGAGGGTISGDVAIQSNLTVDGEIHSTSGGFKFPDNSTQTTAAQSYSAGDGLTLTGTIFSISDSGVTSVKIADGAVNNVDLADSSVTSEKIADGTIQFSDIAQNSADTGQIIKWNGAAWSASNDSVGVAGGWTDDGTIVRLSTGTDNVGIGLNNPSKKLEVAGSIKVGTNDTVFTSNLSSNSPLRFDAPAGTNRMFIDDATGNVGIGTTSPSYLLHVASPVSFSARFENTSVTGSASVSAQAGPAGMSLFAEAGGTGGFGSFTNHPIYFRTNLVERMRITAAGNVGIGTTSPVNKLDVEGGAVIGAGYSGTSTAASNGLLVEGNVNIGTTNTTNKLSVNGNADFTGQVLIGQLGSNPAAWLQILAPVSATSDPLFRAQETGLGGFLDIRDATSTAGQFIPSIWAEARGTGANRHGLLLVGAPGEDQSDDAAVRIDGRSALAVALVNAPVLSVTNFGVELFRIAANGNTGIGTISPAYKLEVSGPVMMEDATAPTASAGHSGVYSSAGELFALDAAGNSTQLSPHDTQTGEWIFYSKNLKTGRVVRVDMERLVKKIEQLTGEQFLMESWEE